MDGVRRHVDRHRVLDTSDPGTVDRFARELPLDKTIFLFASKSGGTLETRSLPVHLGTRGVLLEDLLAALPVTPFPLWVDDVPERAATLLGWTGAPPNDKPLDTVIRLPLRERDAERTLDAMAAQYQQAQQVFMGIQASVRLHDMRSSP